MELVQVIGEDGRINWMINGQEGQQIQEQQPLYNFVGAEQDPLEPDNNNLGQQYILLEDNTVVPLGLLGGLNNFTFLPQLPDEDSDDNEIPPHVLDHMYAKKPREPGTEQVKPPRRRLKKKEMLANQFFVQDTVPDYQEAPKINIIRQRLPGNSSVASFSYRSSPKILHTSRKTPPKSGPWQAQSFMRGDNVMSYTIPNHNASQDRRWYSNPPKVKNQSVVFEESELPQLGALVTVGADGNRKSSSGGRSQYSVTNHNSSSSRSPGRKSSCDYRMVPPAYIEVAIPADLEGMDTDVDGEVDDTELFLDFPMEESEEVSTLDVDFSEIPMSTGGSVGHMDSMNMSPCLQIPPSISESNLISSHFQKSLSSSDSDSSLMMGPDSSLVIKQEFKSISGEEKYVILPQYAPKKKKNSSQSSSDNGDSYITALVNSPIPKKSKSGGRGIGRPPKSANVIPQTPPKPETPVVPLRISSRSRRVPNRLDDGDVILCPVKKSNKR